MPTALIEPVNAVAEYLTVHAAGSGCFLETASPDDEASVQDPSARVPLMA